MDATDPMMPPTEAMSTLITSWWISQIVRTMVVLDLPDHLAGGPRTLDELASLTGTHAPTLRRFLRTLAGLGLCASVEGGRFRLTEQGELLRSDVPHSMRPYALAMTSPYMMEAWEELPWAIQTGAAVFPQVHGSGFWAYLAAHPEDGARFDGAMSGGVAARTLALMSAAPLAGIETLVDVGGGRGTLLAGVLAATPGLSGVLFDQPHVLADAPAVLAAAGVGDRCRMVAGDFFAEVPPNGDAYVLAMIIHDWPDVAATEILRVCHRAMRPGTRLWLIEQVVPPGDAFHRSKLLDMNMLVLFGAQERTAGEYQALLEAAEFAEFAVYPTGTPYSVIEAIRS